MKRVAPHTPMLWLLLPLTLGIIVEQYLALPLLVVALFIAAALLALYFTRRSALLYPAIVGVGYLIASLQGSPVALAEREDATVAIEIHNSWSGRIIGIQSQNDEWSPCNYDILLRGADNAPHSTMVVKGDITPIDGSQNHFWQAMHNKGYTHQLRVSEQISELHNHRLPLTERLNAWAVERLKRLNLSQPSEALCAAVGLARRNDLSSATVESYNRSGTAHLLALSGLHVGVIMLIISVLTYLLPLLRGGHIIADALSILAIWLFALMVGAGQSVVRAALMFSLLKLSLILSRRYNSLNSLFVAAVVIITLDAGAIYDISFSLSFCAVAAIIIFCPPLYRRLYTGHKWIDFTVQSLVVGVVATLATAPIISYNFGYVALLSPLITLPLLLTITVIILFTIIWVLCPIAALAPLFREVLEVSATIQNFVVEWAASLNWGYFDWRVSTVGLYLCYTIFIALAALMLWSKSRPTRPSALDARYSDK